MSHRYCLKLCYISIPNRISYPAMLCGASRCTIHRGIADAIWAVSCTKTSLILDSRRFGEVRTRTSGYLIRCVGHDAVRVIYIGFHIDIASILLQVSDIISRRLVSRHAALLCETHLHCSDFTNPAERCPTPQQRNTAAWCTPIRHHIEPLHTRASGCESCRLVQQQQLLQT